MKTNFRRFLTELEFFGVLNLDQVLIIDPSYFLDLYIIQIFLSIEKTTSLFQRKSELDTLTLKLPRTAEPGSIFSFSLHKS